MTRRASDQRWRAASLHRRSLARSRSRTTYSTLEGRSASSCDSKATVRRLYVLRSLACGRAEESALTTQVRRGEGAQTHLKLLVHRAPLRVGRGRQRADGASVIVEGEAVGAAGRARRTASDAREGGLGSTRGGGEKGTHGCSRCMVAVLLRLEKLSGKLAPRRARGEMSQRTLPVARNGDRPRRSPGTASAMTRTRVQPASFKLAHGPSAVAPSRLPSEQGGSRVLITSRRRRATQRSRLRPRGPVKMTGRAGRAVASCAGAWSCGSGGVDRSRRSARSGERAEATAESQRGRCVDERLCWSLSELALVVEHCQTRAPSSAPCAGTTSPRPRCRRRCLEKAAKRFIAGTGKQVLEDRRRECLRMYIERRNEPTKRRREQGESSVEEEGEGPRLLLEGVRRRRRRRRAQPARERVLRERVLFGRESGPRRRRRRPERRTAERAQRRVRVGDRRDPDLGRRGDMLVQRRGEGREGREDEGGREGDRRDRRRPLDGRGVRVGLGGLAELQAAICGSLVSLTYLMDSCERKRCERKTHSSSSGPRPRQRPPSPHAPPLRRPARDAASQPSRPSF